MNTLRSLFLLSVAGLALAGASSVLPAAADFVAEGAPRTGVLVLAHGGTERWNQTLLQTVKEAGIALPVEVAFGMGMHGGEVEALQAAVSRLEQGGAERIIAVPFLVSSHSEVLRQYAYLLGLRPEGPWMDHAKPVARRVPVELTGPLDDDPAVAEALLDRAREVSRSPAEETVVLIAHGPNEDEDNRAWLAGMDRVAAAVRERGAFQEVVSVTMRDDAAPEVLQRAVAGMRQIIEEKGRQGRVLVLPVLLANGGIEHKISDRLQGLEFTLQPKALLPHPALSAWLARRVETALAESGDEAGAGRISSTETAVR